jgi:hypothetical protein
MSKNTPQTEQLQKMIMEEDSKIKYTKDDAAVFIQDQCKKFLIQKRFKNYLLDPIFKIQKHRYDTIKEILSTEVSHVKQIKLLNDIYYKGMKEKKIAPLDKLQIIFCNSKNLFFKTF